MMYKKHRNTERHGQRAKIGMKKGSGTFNEIPRRLMSLCQTDFPTNSDHYIGPTPNFSVELCLPI